MVRQSMRRSMEAEGFTIVGEAGDGEEAVRLAETHRPDVVLMDISMPVLDGVEATRRLRERVPLTQVVILTMHADADVVRRAIAAGAVGYLTKDCTVEEVIEAIRLAADGDTALASGLARAFLDEATQLARDVPEAILSPRELEVLQLIASGQSPAEVAAGLFISGRTVKNHLASIYEKLDARDRTQAVLKAVRMGIIRLEVD
jgi:DNA-binding NarL/FixJ family response regulator